MSLCLLHEEALDAECFPCLVYWPVKTIAKKLQYSPSAPPKKLIPALRAIHWVCLGGSGTMCIQVPRWAPSTVLSEGFSVLEMVILMTCVEWLW